MRGIGTTIWAKHARPSATAYTRSPVSPTTLSRGSRTLMSAVGTRRQSTQRQEEPARKPRKQYNPLVTGVLMAQYLALITILNGPHPDHGLPGPQPPMPGAPVYPAHPIAGGPWPSHPIAGPQPPQPGQPP